MMRLRLFGIWLCLFLLVSAGQAQDPGVGQPAPAIHVVQRGETLFNIAQQYSTSVEALARANGITTPGSIRVGQRLLIPTLTATTTPAAHTVQPGETLAGIAAVYGTTPEALTAINGLADPNALVVGQILLLTVPTAGEAPSVPLDALPDVSAALIVPGADAPPVNAAPVSPAAPLTVVHTVQRGETLMRIAAAYSADVSGIIAANGIQDPSLIYAGQQLVIPGVTAPQLAAQLPAPITNAQIMPLSFTEGQTGLFRVTTAVPATVTGTFISQPLTFAADAAGTTHNALIGIPLGTAAGAYPAALTITDGAGGTSTLTANVQINAGAFNVETFTLLADRTNLLDTNIDAAELDILRSVTRRFNPTRYFTAIFGLPAAATITSPFGAVRSYDDGAIQRTHIGTDFAGVPGTPILAAADGVVVLADTLNVRGVATVIDHGWGVYTGYFHQTERYVGIGETIREGQVIGTIGSSGRVSGPHLHWELWVNGVPVDPMQWVIMGWG